MAQLVNSFWYFLHFRYRVVLFDQINQKYIQCKIFHWNYVIYKRTLFDA